MTHINEQKATTKPAKFIKRRTCLSTIGDSVRIVEKSLREGVKL